jgi:hypothetical protein
VEDRRAESRGTLCCVITAADRTLRLDVAKGEGTTAFGKAGLSNVRAHFEVEFRIEVEVADKRET